MTPIMTCLYFVFNKSNNSCHYGMWLLNHASRSGLNKPNLSGQYDKRFSVKRDDRSGARQCVRRCYSGGCLWHSGRVPIYNASLNVPF